MRAIVCVCVLNEHHLSKMRYTVTSLLCISVQSKSCHVKYHIWIFITRIFIIVDEIFFTIPPVFCKNDRVYIFLNEIQIQYAYYDDTFDGETMGLYQNIVLTLTINFHWNQLSGFTTKQIGLVHSTQFKVPIPYAFALALALAFFCFHLWSLFFRLCCIYTKIRLQKGYNI